MRDCCLGREGGLRTLKMIMMAVVLERIGDVESRTGDWQECKVGGNGFLKIHDCSGVV